MGGLARPRALAQGEERSPVVGARAGAAKAATGASPGSRSAGGNAAARIAAKAYETSGGLRGAGEELRTRLRTRRRLRVVTLLSLAVVVLVVLPAVFGIATAAKDPVFSSLDALKVPAWAAKDLENQGSGSRWCFLECRFRERVAQSDKAFADTTKVYAAALTAAGWQPWKVGQCPEFPIAADQGTYTCWKRDEFTLDLWVRLPECEVDQIAANDPAAVQPSAAAAPAPGTCQGSTVSIKVQNAVFDPRGKPDNGPPLVGVTPDPVLSNDPLLESPTPKAS